MRTRSPLPDAEPLEHRGHAVDLVVELAVGVHALLAGLGRDVDDRLLLAALGQVAVDRVVAEVGLAADEPPRERRLRVVEDLRERLVPVDELGLLAPERLGLQGALVELWIGRHGSPILLPRRSPAVSDHHRAFWPPKVPEHLTVPETSLWHNLEVSAARFPRKPCVLFYDSMISYAALKEESERLAGFLQSACGVGRGDRVGLYLQNSPQFIIGYYAILRADAMVVPINPMLLTQEVAHILGDSGAKVMIAAQELYPRLEPLLGHGLEHAIVACYADHLTARTDLDVPAAIAAPRQPIAAPGVTLWSAAV